MSALVIAFILSLVATLLVVRYSHLHEHLTADCDTSGVQKFHSSPVPRVGGLGLVIGLIGVGLVVKDKLTFDAASYAGIVLCVFALVSITAGTLYQKRFCPRLPRAHQPGSCDHLCPRGADDALEPGQGL